MTVAVVLCALLVPALSLGHSSTDSKSPSVKVPGGFVGMMADGPIFDRGVNLNHQMSEMAQSGVQSIRVEFNWARAQPYSSWNDVPLAYSKYFSGPKNSVPTYFLATDRVVALAASHHLTVLPVVIAAPSWDGDPAGNHIEPLHDAPYGTYLKELVHRYGPHGTFWSKHRSVPREPISMWQVWNEPDLPYFWNRSNFARSYVALLRVAHRAIKRADPRAKVVLASLTGDSWRGLGRLYGIQGTRSLFDVVGENTYAPSPGRVLEVLRHVRTTMDRNGDRNKPLLDTEVGWPSALGKSELTLGVATTEHGQATKLAALLPMLAANRKALGLAGFYYYTWVSTDVVGSPSPFVFAGLFRYDPDTHTFHAKPAFAAFRSVVRRLEGAR
jgi:hypothetical protein